MLKTEVIWNINYQETAQNTRGRKGKVKDLTVTHKSNGHVSYENIYRLVLYSLLFICSSQPDLKKQFLAIQTNIQSIQTVQKWGLNLPHLELHDYLRNMEVYTKVLNEFWKRPERPFQCSGMSIKKAWWVLIYVIYSIHTWKFCRYVKPILPWFSCLI